MMPSPMMPSRGPPASDLSMDGGERRAVRASMRFGPGTGESALLRRKETRRL